MLNHIVMWKIKEDVEDKEKVKLGIKNGLEGLFGKIEELREIIKNYIKPFVYDRVCIDFFE